MESNRRYSIITLLIVLGTLILLVMPFLPWAKMSERVMGARWDHVSGKGYTEAFENYNYMPVSTVHCSISVYTSGDISLITRVDNYTGQTVNGGEAIGMLDENVLLKGSGVVTYKDAEIHNYQLGHTYGAVPGKTFAFFEHCLPHVWKSNIPQDVRERVLKLPSGPVPKT